MLEEDADIKRLFIRKTGAGPKVEIAGVGKVSLEERILDMIKMGALT